MTKGWWFSSVVQVGSRFGEASRGFGPRRRHFPDRRLFSGLAGYSLAASETRLRVWRLIELEKSAQ